MANSFERACEPSQGFNFKQDEHHTFGYITRMTIGDQVLPADVFVRDPFGATGAGTSTASGIGATATAAGTLQKQVVAVLTNVTWDYTPTGIVKLEGIVSLFNMNNLAAIAIIQTKGVGVQVEWVVYDYDVGQSKFFPAFYSAAGNAPITGQSADIKGSANTTDTNAKPCFAVLGKEGQEFGVKVGTAPEEAGGTFQGFKATLTLAPPRSKLGPQQVIVQTSLQHKLVLPWGLPQNAGGS